MAQLEKKLPNFPLDRMWKVLLILILTIYAAVEAREILLPIFLSFFLAILLNPIVSFFQKKCRFNLAISIVITMILIGALLVAGIYYISFQARGLIMDLPDLTNKLNLYIYHFGNTIEDIGILPIADATDLLKENTDKILSSSGKFLSSALSFTSDFISFLSLVPIYVFFILLYKKNFKLFLNRIDRSDEQNFSSISKEVNLMVHNYIVGLSIVIGIIAILNTVGLLALGIKYAVFMGVLSALLTIIPYIGIFIGGLLPVLVALLTKDSLFYPLAVIALIALVQFLEGNFITPNIIGSKVNVNPLAAIIALIIGAKIWGIMGMILAIPITGITKIIFSHYNQLKPYAILLESSHEEEQDTSNKQFNIKEKWKALIGRFKTLRKEQ